MALDQTPKLLETFDQLIRSSEIRSSDPLSYLWLTNYLGDRKLKIMLFRRSISWKILYTKLQSGDWKLIIMLFKLLFSWLNLWLVTKLFFRRSKVKKILFSTSDILKNEKNCWSPDQKKLWISCFDLPKYDLLTPSQKLLKLNAF